MEVRPLHNVTVLNKQRLCYFTMEKFCVSGHLGIKEIPVFEHISYFTYLMPHIIKVKNIESHKTENECFWSENSPVRGAAKIQHDLLH